jgi:hypothetical protein
MPVTVGGGGGMGLDKRRLEVGDGMRGGPLRRELGMEM